MKYIFAITLLLNTALLTAMQGNSSSLLEKQQYAARIQELSAQLGCSNNHAQDACSMLAKLTHQTVSVETAQLASATINVLREQHTQLTNVYTQLTQNPLAQHFQLRLNKIATSLALLNAHTNTALIALATLHIQPEQSTQSA